MTTVASRKANRNSAIFLGAGAPPNISVNTPPALPDLPEPPSPGSSSNGSGLPSPPATNSTGSGSTGDPSSIAFRKRPISMDSNSSDLLNEANVKAFHAAFSKDDDDDHDNNDNDEDNTARLDRKLMLRDTNENVEALKRVKTLTQRNRLALDKLSSYSRLSTPSPRPGSRAHATPPASSHTASSSSSASSGSSSRPSYQRARHSHHGAAEHLSGSETERESIHEPISYNSTTTSTSATNSILLNRSSPPQSQTKTSSARIRLISAPVSPAKALRGAAATTTPQSPSRRKRASMIGPGDLYDEPAPDIAQLALAAVAASRRSPTSAAKRRQPLPTEFRDEDVSQDSREPPSARGKYSTVRDTKRHSIRWSEDLSQVPSTSGEPETGRRQSLRGGSAESALAQNARSLVGEGLRAAGISRRPRESAGHDYEDDDQPERSHSRLSGHTGSDHRTRAGTITRASTSMANYNLAPPDPAEPKTAPAGLRTYKSAYPISQRELDITRRDTPERERAGSSMSRYGGLGAGLPAQDRDRYSSPLPGKRASMTVTGSALKASLPQEHARLMLESLGVFESNLTRVPQLSDGAAETLVEHANAVVLAAEKLNGLLRHGTNRALEEQIDAEVGETPTTADLIDMWRVVGGEYREGLRASDELVRSVTSLLLGVGRAVRDACGGPDGHGRSLSLDDDALNVRRTMTPDDGRASRKSWEHKDDLISRFAARPDSVLSVARPPSALRTTIESPKELSTPLSAKSRLNGALPSSSMRRVYTPRHEDLPAADSHDTLQGYEPSPTPASRTRPPQDSSTLSRSRTLPSINIPKPLPSLPSESTRRSQQQSDARTAMSSSSGGTNTISRRKNTITGATPTTVRGPLFPGLSAPGATTALTPHTVSTSPEKLAFPALTRQDSSGRPIGNTHGNIGVGRSSSVTFSRLSSVSALSGLQQQQDADRRKRTTSTGSDHDAPLNSASTTSPTVRLNLQTQTKSHYQSESETESAPRFRDRTAPRVSLDGGARDRDRDRDVTRAADRSAAAGILATGGNSTKRRGTLTGLFPGQ